MAPHTKSRAKPACMQASSPSLPSYLVSLLARAHIVTSDSILRLPSVRLKTGRAGPTVWKDVSNGTFPPPIRIGPRAVGWLESEINAWLEACAYATRCPNQQFDMKVFVAELTAFRGAQNDDSSCGGDCASY